MAPAGRKPVRSRRPEAEATAAGEETIAGVTAPRNRRGSRSGSGSSSSAEQSGLRTVPSRERRRGIRPGDAGVSFDRNAETIDSHPATADPDRTRLARPGELNRTRPDSRSLGATVFTDKYEMGHEIGRGGLGVVNQAEDRAIGREVAIKVLARLKDADAIHEFVEEAQITGQLEHPNIVPVYDLGHTQQADGSTRPFMAMKLVRGETLQERIDGLRRRRALSTADALTRDGRLEVFLKICDALSYAHSRRVVHRDLKPENVMLGEFGEVLLMDWGLAKPLGEAGRSIPEALGLDEESEAEAWPEGSASDSRTGRPGGSKRGSRSSAGRAVRSSRREDQGIVTMQGEVFGTPSYMAPEQAAGAVTEVDERTDIFALGGILYSLLAFAPPYAGTDVGRIVADARARKLLPPRSRAPQARIPKALDAITMRAMEKDPRKRYRSVAELRADVTAFLANERVAAHRSGLVDRLIKWTRRNPALAVGNAFGVLLLLVGGLLTTLWLNAQSVADRERLERDKAELLASQADERATESEAEAEEATRRKADLEAAVSRERDEARRGLVELYQAWRAENPTEPEGEFFRQATPGYIGGKIIAFETAHRATMQQSSVGSQFMTPLDYYLLGMLHRYGRGESEIALRWFDEALRLVPGDGVGPVVDMEGPDVVPADPMTDESKVRATYEQALLRVEREPAEAYEIASRLVDEVAPDMFPQPVRNRWHRLRVGAAYEAGRLSDAVAAIDQWRAELPADAADAVPAEGRPLRLELLLEKVDLAVHLRDTATVEASRAEVAAADEDDPRLGAIDAWLMFEALDGVADESQSRRVLGLLDEAMAAEPDGVLAHLLRAMVVRSTGRIGEVADHLVRLRALYPRDRFVTYELAAVRNLQGQLAAAVELTTGLIEEAWPPILPDALLLRGAVYQFTGEMNAALADVGAFREVATETHHNYTMSIALEIELLMRQQKGEAAARVATDYLADKPMTRELLDVAVRLAAIRASQGQLPEAIVEIEGLVDEFPDHGFAWFTLGRLYQARARMADAEHAYNEAVQNEPGNSEYWIDLIRLHLAMQPQDTAGAVRTLGRFIAAQPGNASAYSYRAQIYKQLGRLDEAVDDYTAALDLRENDANLWLQRGSILMMQDNVTGAKLDFDRALALEPEMHDARIQRAEAFRRAAMYEQALADYMVVFDVPRFELQARFGVGAIRIDQGFNREGIQMLTDAIDLADQSIATLRARQPRSPAEAAANEREIRTIIQGRANCVGQRATGYMNNGDHAEAEADLRVYLETNDQLPEMWINLANAIGNQGRHEEAVAELERALQVLRNPAARTMVRATLDRARAQMGSGD